MPSSAEKAAPERPADDDRRHQRRELAGDREPDEIGDEDVGAELLQLDRGLEGGHEPDQEVDHQHDRDAVGAGALHQTRHVAPVDAPWTTQRSQARDHDVADEVEPVALAEQRHRLAPDLVEDADGLRRLAHARPRRVRAVELEHREHRPARAHDLGSRPSAHQLGAQLE